MAKKRADDGESKAAADFEEAATTALQAQSELEEAKAVIKELTTQLAELNATIDTLRAAGAAKPSSSAPLEVVRAILKLEPLQTRDDGGRIVHLTKQVIERAIAVV